MQFKKGNLPSTSISARMKHDSDILDFSVMFQEAFQPFVGRVEGQVAHEDVVIFDPSIKFTKILKIQTINLGYDLNTGHPKSEVI